MIDERLYAAGCRHRRRARLTEIYAHAVLHGTASYELVPPTEAEMLLRFEGLVAQGYPYIVAVDTAAGSSATPMPGRSACGPPIAGRSRIRSTITPEAHGRGVGRALLIRLLALCEAKGFRQMIAVIGGSDHDPSIRLHERAGFRTIGIFQGSGFKFGKWIDTVLMQLPLGDGNKSLPDEGVYPGILPTR